MANKMPEDHDSPHHIKRSKKIIKKTVDTAATVTFLFAEKAVPCTICGKIILESKARKDSQGNNYCAFCWNHHL
jgi:hypothetical protein